LTVGLHLPQLIEQSGPSVAPELFLRKLGSLARLALSAAGQADSDGQTDSASQTVTVSHGPDASFTFAPRQPLEVAAGRLSFCYGFKGPAVRPTPAPAR